MNAINLIKNPLAVTAWIFLGKYFAISLKTVSIRFRILDIKYSIWGLCGHLELLFLLTNSRRLVSPNISSTIGSNNHMYFKSIKIAPFRRIVASIFLAFYDSRTGNSDVLTDVNWKTINNTCFHWAAIKTTVIISESVVLRLSGSIWLMVLSISSKNTYIEIVLSIMVNLLLWFTFFAKVIDWPWCFYIIIKKLLTSNLG